MADSHIARCALAIVVAIGVAGSSGCRSTDCTADLRVTCVPYTVVDDAPGTPICDAAAERDDGMSAGPACDPDAGQKACEYSMWVSDEHWHFTVSRDGYAPRAASA